MTEQKKVEREGAGAAESSRNFLSMLKLASVRLWIEFYESAA